MTQISIRDLTVDIDLTVPKRFIVIHSKKYFNDLWSHFSFVKST